MATIRPKLNEIITRIHNDAVARLDDESLRRSDLAVFERIIAGASHALYASIEYNRKQLFPDSAEVSYLERFGSTFGITRKQAVRATGSIKFNWISAIEVPVGTVLQSALGYQYATTTSVTTEGVCSVQSVETGALYDLAKDEELTLTSPILGITNAVVTSAITGGEDAETDDSLRARILEHTRNPPRQGTKDDYVAWAKEVTGVGYAWCYPKELGDGSVTVRILDEDGEFPTTELIEKVKEYVESKASVLATIYVVSPVALTVDITLQITPDNLTMRARAEEALAKLFKDEAEPGKTLYLSHINRALSDVTDEENHVLVLPAADVVPTSSSYMPILGVVSWQEE